MSSANWMRVLTGGSDDVMRVLTARLAELGATTRAARVAMYDSDTLSLSVVTDLETGARGPTEEEQAALYDAGLRLGWFVPRSVLASVQPSGS